LTTGQRLRLKALVKGRVQGVGFRYFVMNQARELGLRGWVCNRWEGTVQLVAEGEQDSLQKLVSALWQGPRTAFVTNVQQEWEQATGEFQQFEIRHSI